MASPTLSTTRFWVVVAFLLSVSCQLQLVLAQGSSSSSSSSNSNTASSTTSGPAPSRTPSTTAKVYPGTANWDYYGCWNETTYLNGTGNVRALAGASEASDTMTVDTCLDYCRGQGLAFAGLEYTRECYCAQHVNSLSMKLGENNCDLACMGNDTQICGGALTLTVYQAKKSSTKGAGSTIAREAPVGSILALGIAMGTLFCLT